MADKRERQATISIEHTAPQTPGVTQAASASTTRTKKLGPMNWREAFAAVDKAFFRAIETKPEFPGPGHGMAIFENPDGVFAVPLRTIVAVTVTPQPLAEEEDGGEE